MRRLGRAGLGLILAWSILSRALAQQEDPPTERSAPEAPVATEPSTPPPEPARRHADAPTSHAQRYVLENGLHVVLDPNDEDTVAVAVVYGVGSSVQPPGWTGLAHLAEHVMFEGTTHTAGHFLDQLDALGVLEVNGTTERDRTRYYEVVPREHLERVLYLEADRMAFVSAHLTDRVVALQREVVLREREERVDLGGLGLVPGLIASVLYVAPGHPYAELFEHREDIQAIRTADLQWFLSTYYAPDTATLAVSGGFDADQARAWIARWFGPIRRVGEAPPPVAVPEITRVPVERRLVVEAPLRHDQLHVIWPTPPYGTPEDAALDLIADRLERRLRAELLDTLRATSVTVTQSSYETASELVVDVVTPRGDGTLFALEAIDRAVEALTTEPPDAREVRRLAQDRIADDLEGLESSTLRVSRLARRISRAPAEQWSLEWDRDRWSAVTPEQIRDVARTWLPLHQRLVLSLAARRDAPWDGRVVVDLSLGPDGREIAP